MEKTVLIEQIKEALGTDQDGKALVAVARRAHCAEQELAVFRRLARERHEHDGHLDPFPYVPRRHPIYDCWSEVNPATGFRSLTGRHRVLQPMPAPSNTLEWS
jgi:hypothetical protein